MPDLTREQLHQLARLGAEARLVLLDAEATAIKSAYPDLAASAPPRRPRRRASKPAMPEHAEVPVVRPRRRHTMSAAERRAVSERMKKYWAERRKAKAGQKK
jgi:hypothetical protein